MFSGIEYARDISDWDVSNVSDCKNFSSEGGDWKPNFTNCTE